MKGNGQHAARRRPWFFVAVATTVLAGCSNTNSGTPAEGAAPGSSAKDPSAAPSGTRDAGPLGQSAPSPTPTPTASTAAGSACLPPLARCDAAGATCCDGSVCVPRDGVSKCVQTCSTRFDCGSLCCVDDRDAGQKLCAEQDQCPPLPCSNVGGSCSQPGPSCCAGLACVSSSSPLYGGCRTPCTLPSDCSTGCCVPYADGTPGFCAAAGACQCAAADATCGGTAHCCPGLSCTTFDGTGAFACKPTCATNADCATGCCRPIVGTSESACLSKTWCVASE